MSWAPTGGRLPPATPKLTLTCQPSSITGGEVGWRAFIDHQVEYITTGALSGENAEADCLWHYRVGVLQVLIHATTAYQQIRKTYQQQE